MVDLAERILAIGLVIAAQAIDLRRPGRLGVGTKQAYDHVRAVVPFMDVGDSVPSDLDPVRELIRSGDLSPASR
jgi:histidine ammonia-lyase